MTTLKKIIPIRSDVSFFEDTETVIGAVGSNNIVIAVDASDGLFYDNRFVICTETKNGLDYLGSAYIDEKNEAHIDLLQGGDFAEEIYEMVSEQMKLAKDYQEYGDTVCGTTKINYEGNGYLTVNLTQDAYPDYDPSDDDEYALWRATALTPTGKKLMVFWWVEKTDDGENEDPWAFVIADDWDEY